MRLRLSAPDVVVEDVGFGSYVVVVAKSVGVVAAFGVHDCVSFFLLGESGRATSTPLFFYPSQDQQSGFDVKVSKMK